MTNQEKKILNPLIDDFTRAFFITTKFDVSLDECNTLVRANRHGVPAILMRNMPEVNECIPFTNYQEIHMVARKEKGMISYVWSKFNAVASIRIQNQVVNELLARLTYLKGNEPNLYGEDQIVDLDANVNTFWWKRQALINAVTSVLRQIVAKRLDWQWDKTTRPKVIVIGCGPLTHCYLQDFHGTYIGDFKVYVVSTVHVEFRNKIVVSLCDPEKPLGHLFVSRTPISYVEEKGSPRDLEFLGRSLSKVMFHKASMGLITFDENDLKRIG